MNWYLDDAAVDFFHHVEDFSLRNRVFRLDGAYRQDFGIAFHRRGDGAGRIGEFLLGIDWSAGAVIAGDVEIISIEDLIVG